MMGQNFAGVCRPCQRLQASEISWYARTVRHNEALHLTVRYTPRRCASMVVVHPLFLADV